MNRLAESEIHSAVQTVQACWIAAVNHSIKVAFALPHHADLQTSRIGLSSTPFQAPLNNQNRYAVLFRLSLQLFIYYPARMHFKLPSLFAFFQHPRSERDSPTLVIPANPTAISANPHPFGLQAWPYLDLANSGLASSPRTPLALRRYLDHRRRAKPFPPA